MEPIKRLCKSYRLAKSRPREFLPVELVFNPNWWHHTAGISFDEPFYLDAATRVRDDVTMRRVLYQRYGELGLGQADPQPHPVIGSVHVAGGFVIPALWRASLRREHAKVRPRLRGTARVLF